MQRPETRYVAVGEADVAYQVLGHGGTDLLYCYGIGSHIEQCWDLPPMAEFISALASLGRLIMFDRRGTGASDPVPSGAISTWEGWAEDIGAVLDAAGSEKAAILARSDAGPMAIFYAVSHPERVSALVLYNTTARYLRAPGYPIGYTDEAVASMLESMRTSWGRPEYVARSNPAMAGKPFIWTCSPGCNGRCRGPRAHHGHLHRHRRFDPARGLTRRPALARASRIPPRCGAVPAPAGQRCGDRHRG